MAKRRRPCAVCGSREWSSLSAHHYIPKEFRIKGTAQYTMKLCRDKKGCRTHLDFHLGDEDAAMRIRNQMPRHHREWLVAKMGEEWVDKTYPV